MYETVRMRLEKLFPSIISPADAIGTAHDMTTFCVAFALLKMQVLVRRVVLDDEIGHR